MRTKANLDSFIVVLVRPKFHENIGSVARAMKNMGLSRLVIVDGASPLHPNAYRLASGAEEILERAEEMPTLREAIADMGCGIAMTCRKGKGRNPLLAPAVMARKMIALSAKNRIGLVFGSERTGLTNEELSQCHGYVRIPSAESFPSLNLAQAVMVVAYEVFRTTRQSPVPCVEAIRSEELNRLFDHMGKTLHKIGFLDPNNPERIMRVLRQVFIRSAIDEREVRILHGMLSKMDWQMGRRTEGRKAVTTHKSCGPLRE